MNYKPLVIIKARVRFARSINTKDYTAKLVKSMLIQGNPKLEELFSKSRDLLPKPVHITPLYIYNISGDNRVKLEAVYTKLVPHDYRRRIAKPPKLSDLKPVRIYAGKEYFFYVGIPITLIDEVLMGLTNFGVFRFGKELVELESLSYELRYVDIEKEKESVLEKLLEALETSNEEELSSSMRVTFESPALLKDPLVLMRRKKKKLLLPLPEAVLATPFIMVLLDRGKFRNTLFLRCMRYIKSIFDIPYTVLKTVNLVWYVYDNNVLPALIGYAKYYMDLEVLTHIHKMLSIKYGIDFIDLLAETLILANTYGIGDSRATGFGHVTIRIQKQSKPDKHNYDSLWHDNLMAGNFTS